MNEHEITLRGYRAGNKNGCDILRLGTNGSYGVERLHLVPDGDWEGLTITAVFHAPDGTAIQVLADGGTVDVPPEATASAGRGKVIFIGSAQGQQRISCDLAYNVLGHAVAEGTEPAGPAPSWYEQAAAHFLPDGGKARQVLAKASDADLDVEWADGGNGTADHAKLSNRDASDQHPISAITGLETALDGKQPTGDYLTADTLQAATDAALAQAKESGEFDGADGAPGKDGADGQPGENGTDGYSPTANVTQNDNGATITITDKNGTTTATVTNGKDGADGNPGADGAPGADGKSAYAYAVEGGYTGTEAEFAAKLAQEKFANPYALTFAGAVTGSYDGSEPLTVEIPGGGGEETELPIIQEYTIEGDETASIVFTGLHNISEFLLEIAWTWQSTAVAGTVRVSFSQTLSGYNHRVGRISSVNTGSTGKIIIRGRPITKNGNIVVLSAVATASRDVNESLSVSALRSTSVISVWWADSGKYFPAGTTVSLRGK